MLLGGAPERTKYLMRFYEFKTIKPKKPMKPAQYRVYSLKQNVDRARTALRTEKEAQRRKRDIEKQRNAQGSALG